MKREEIEIYLKIIETLKSISKDLEELTDIIDERENETWFDNNTDEIIEAYGEAFPESVRNNGDPYSYLDLNEIYEWAVDNRYNEK